MKSIHTRISSIICAWIHGRVRAHSFAIRIHIRTYKRIRVHYIGLYPLSTMDIYIGWRLAIIFNASAFYIGIYPPFDWFTQTNFGVRLSYCPNIWHFAAGWFVNLPYLWKFHSKETFTSRIGNKMLNIRPTDNKQRNS